MPRGHCASLVFLFRRRQGAKQEWVSWELCLQQRAYSSRESGNSKGGGYTFQFRGLKTYLYRSCEISRRNSLLKNLLSVPKPKEQAAESGKSGTNGEKVPAGRKVGGSSKASRQQPGSREGKVNEAHAGESRPVVVDKKFSWEWERKTEVTPRGVRGATY